MSILHASRKSAAGFTLVELLISLVLGLLVTLAAIGLFLTSRRTAAATDSLSRVQENARIALELMARDIREAGGNPCNSSNNMAMVNVLSAPASRWWTNWNVGTTSGTLQGYDGSTAIAGINFGTTTAGQRIAGTDALTLLSSGDATAVVTVHAPASATFTVNTAAHGLIPGDLLMVCGPNAETGGVMRLGAIFQMTGSAGTASVGHGASGSPGNATNRLGLGGSLFTFGSNASITRLNASAWYIGTNGRTRGLYQSTLINTGGVASVQAQEVAEGVQNMAVTYLVDGTTSYGNAASVTGRWSQVTAVRITLTLAGTDRDGVDNAALSRTVSQVITLRNRAP
ncbi:PilW family protein [Xanthomonas campestris pv. plantaginis]|uniref:PilW family protein n=1 Tax=Xanthomonas campestris TaxID=339 RepID=UPI002B231AAA|nr:PilW family protein [Xanthomonas campestris]MEA9608115.1 PilW family protein [Xanthomonas campestris pv. plantaginis]